MHVQFQNKQIVTHFFCLIEHLKFLSIIWGYGCGLTMFQIEIRKKCYDFQKNRYRDHDFRISGIQFDFLPNWKSRI